MSTTASEIFERRSSRNRSAMMRKDAPMIKRHKYADLCSRIFLSGSGITSGRNRATHAGRCVAVQDSLLDAQPLADGWVVRDVNIVEC